MVFFLQLLDHSSDQVFALTVPCMHRGHSCDVDVYKVPIYVCDNQLMHEQ